MYNTILFDLDGTLTDPGIGITNSVAYALKKWNITVSDRSELYKFIGPPLMDSFEKYYGFSQEQCRAALGFYREYFAEKGIFENKVYDGIPQLLSAIKKQGKKVVLATSKPDEFAVTILKHFGLFGYFDFIAGASMDETRNKKSDVIAYALEALGLEDTKELLMVGDRDCDVLGAARFGIDSLGVTYGYGSPYELKTAGATYIVDKVSDILSYIS